MTSIKAEPVNLFRTITTSREQRGVATITTQGRLGENPLVTQQDVAWALPILTKHMGDRLKSPMLDKLMASKVGDLERILCGTASGITCMRAIAIENGETEIPNATWGAKMLATICLAHGSPGVDPISGTAYEHGWMAFTNPQSDVNKWDIYHHALAYEIEESSQGEIKATGIHNFELDDLKEHLENGVKFIVSVDNKIITEEQLNSKSTKLIAGTHLISILGMSEDSQWILVADPYVESFSNESQDSIPKWMPATVLDSFLTGKSERRGIAVAAYNIDLNRDLKQIGYLLAKPGIIKK